ncbi:MAG: transporter substrate-binding domain-containing protein [Deltaproteobacteria bacterium]|nr:transporter substrate-binding domain-containing protein [Deltaproteobacteria bacterium]
MPSWMCRRCQRLFDDRPLDGRCTHDGGALVEVAAPRSEDEHSGRVYDEKYRVGRLIGRGGMGCVHEATNLRLEQPVAIKFFAPLAGDATGVTPGAAPERFRREAVTTVRLRHANVVEVLDFAVDPDGTQYIVMELLEGTPLDVALGLGGLTVGRALEILGLVLKAVEYAHRQGVIHRDLKPGNVFLARIGGRETVKVLDFGIARIAELATITSGPVGTLHFAAPEQIAGERVTPAADVYSAGMMIHEMLAGGLPPVRKLGHDLPAALRRLVERATSAAPAARHADAGELRRALEDAERGLTAAERERPLPRPAREDGSAPEWRDVRGEEPAVAATTPPPTGPAAHTGMPRDRPAGSRASRTVAIAGAALALVALAVVALLFWRGGGPATGDGGAVPPVEVSAAPPAGPAAPVPADPADGSDLRSYPVPLRWDAAGAAADSGYVVEVVRVEGGRPAEPTTMRTPLTYANWPWDESVPAPGTYRWRVRVGGEPPGEWSAPRTFHYFASALERVRSTGVLRVGREVTYHRPFVYLDPQSGDVVGFDVELARELARRLGAEPRFVELDWSTGLFQSLDEDRTDVVLSAVSITESRRGKWSFSRPYLRTAQRFTVRVDDPRTFDAALETFVAGAQRGTSSAEVVLEARGEPRVRLFESVDLGVAALAASEIDALVVDESISPARRDARFRLAGAPLSEEGYGVMARKGEESLVAAIDGVLDELQRSGWLDALLRRYDLPDELPRPAAP